MNHPPKKPLKSFFPTYMTGSIFSQMPSAPWAQDSAGLQMDIAYFGEWSGYKLPTLLVKELSTNGVADSQKIADMLWKLYGRSWSRLWEAYNLDYVPTDNYNVLETIDRTQTSDRTIGKTSDTTGSVNTTTGGTESITTSANGSTTNNSKVDTTEDETTTVQYGKVDTYKGETDTFTYPFNETQRVPTSVVTDENSNTQSGSDTTTRNLVGVQTVDGSTTSKDDGTSSTTTTGTEASVKGEKVKEDTTDNDNEKEDITRNRTGNMGQTSYQDLIRQELELRKWSFFRQVFSDCDRLLALSVYDTCILDIVN